MLGSGLLEGPGNSDGTGALGAQAQRKKGFLEAGVVREGFPEEEEKLQLAVCVGGISCGGWGGLSRQSEVLGDRPQAGRCCHGVSDASPTTNIHLAPIACWALFHTLGVQQ